MPSVLIEVRQNHPTETEQGIRKQYTPHFVTASKSHPVTTMFDCSSTNHTALSVHPIEKNLSYTHISVLIVLRVDRLKQNKLYHCIVNNLEKFGIPPDHVKIMLREITPENWGIRGGHTACDIDLGFKIDV